MIFIKFVSCDYVLNLLVNFVKQVCWLVDFEEIFYFIFFKFCRKSIIEKLCEFKELVNDLVDRIFCLNGNFFLYRGSCCDIYFRKGYIVDSEIDINWCWDELFEFYSECVMSNQNDLRIM